VTMQDTKKIDADLQTFVAKSFLPQLILAIGMAAHHGSSLEKVAVSHFWLKMRGSLYKCRREVYRLAGIKNPRRLDSFMQPHARAELGVVEVRKFLLRDIHAEFETFCDRILAELSIPNGFDKASVADPKRCAKELKQVVGQILTP